jgi:D-serine deaminase-like pyridoxal phosphate-dependent protein
MNHEKDWYTITDVDNLDSPALVVYPERVKHNIDFAISMIGDVNRLRPHVKTHKSPDVTQLMLDAGINKFKCATIAEAEMLGMCKAPDVLLAYQPDGPKLKRFIGLITQYPDTYFSCLVDNIESAKEISAEAEKSNIIIPVYLDINVGQNRTGILAADALELYMACSGLPGVKPLGLHAYDGHIHESDFNTRVKLCNSSYEPVVKLQAGLKTKGYDANIIAGGSPTFPVHAKRETIECSPGTFVYWDKGYQSAFAEQGFLMAALVISRVVSLPGGGLICLDAGHKSVAPENVLTKRIYFLNAPDLVFTGQSEEHLVADAGANHHYKIGDVLYGLPYHICPTVSEYERAVTIESNKISGEWMNIARDRKITI